jgi:copper chaperone NosL
MERGEAMKRILICGIVLLCCFSLVGIASAQDDIKKFPACKYCGMDRAKFAHTRVLIEYDDGTSQGTCSIHCAAMDLALNIDKTPKVIWVGDFNTKNLIDAEKASWVIGGSRMGVMTKNAKWAFSNKQDAEAFIKVNGGKEATFDQAMKASYEDMYADTKMIREKRKMMKMKMKEKK